LRRASDGLVRPQRQSRTKEQRHRRNGASDAAKIDPVMALFNTVALLSQNPEFLARSVYEDGHNLLVM
jgi:phage terminase large subunit-like protein